MARRSIVEDAAKGAGTYIQPDVSDSTLSTVGGTGLEVM